MCNLPIPAFTVHNQMAVTTAQGARIPQQVFFTFSLRKKIHSPQLLYYFCAAFHQIVPDLGFLFANV